MLSVFSTALCNSSSVYRCVQTSMVALLCLGAVRYSHAIDLHNSLVIVSLLDEANLRIEVKYNVIVWVADGLIADISMGVE